MADKKVSELSAITNLSQDDLLLVVDDPAGTPSSKKVTVGNLFGNVAVATTHKGVTTFTANTNHTGTTATFSSNVVATGTMTVGGVNIKSAVDDRLQVANAEAKFVANTYLTANYPSNTYLNATYSTTDEMNVFAGSYTTNSQFQSYISNTNPRVTQLESDWATTSTQITTGVLNSTTANTSILKVTTKSSDPATSNAATESITAGTIFYSNTYLYIATDSNTIKRVALSTF